MKKREFYFEYDDKEDTWAVVEIEAGHEHGQWYDAVVFYCASKQDAVDAIEFLLELQGGTK